MAMGGVINIVTREPTKTGVAADVSYGSFNTSTAEISTSLAVNDKLKVGLSYNHTQSAGYNTTPAQYRNVNLVPTASKADNVAFSAFLTPSESLKLYAKAYFNQTYEDGLAWTYAHNNWSTYRLLLGGSYQARREFFDQLQCLGRRRLVRHHQRGERCLYAEQHQRHQPVRQPDRDSA